MTFQLIQTLYWLSLATWFGGVLFIALSSPVIHRTVRESNPILPDVLAVNLENQHAALLAGTIVSNLLAILSNIQLICAGVVFVMLIGQWIMIPLNDLNVWQGLLRSILFVAAVGVAAYERFWVTPRARRYREEYIEHADDPDVANAAKDRFDYYDRESVRTLLAIVVVLSLMIVFSANIHRF